jgi:hypothetical protein
MTRYIRRVPIARSPDDWDGARMRSSRRANRYGTDPTQEEVGGGHDHDHQLRR